MASFRIALCREKLVYRQICLLLVNFLFSLPSFSSWGMEPELRFRLHGLAEISQPTGSQLLQDRKGFI